jgi:hypothetical protein
MPKINVDPDTWAWVVWSYLFDKCLNMDDVSIGNEEVNDIMRKIRPRLFPLSRELYLAQPSDMRIKYKLIKDAFRKPTSVNSVFIQPRGKSKEEDPNVVKKIVKKVIKMIKSSNEFNEKELQILNEMLECEEELLNG